ncbi:MAG: hypothetical protein WA874_14560 [Chryseosolibacter sp.]
MILLIISRLSFIKKAVINHLNVHGAQPTVHGDVPDLIIKKRRAAFVRPSFFFIPALIVLIGLLSSPLHAQVLGEMEDESRLYAESKQVNQFFRRFNGEEDERGNRYYPGDKQHRSDKLRRQYLRMLFDESNQDISTALKTNFVKDILDKPEASILNFHGGNWFSELRTTFTMNGKNQTVILFMELEKHRLGTRWVIQKVHADMFQPYFDVDTVRTGRFLHPMSHEIDFMNLRKAFANKDSINQYIVKRFVPDHLSLFLYEIKKGNLKFKSVDEVKFHFFQIDGWYFGLSEFNRPGYNTGWLISNLVKLNNRSDKDLLRKFLYYETQ